MKYSVATGQVRDVISGLSKPQGLTLFNATLYYSDMNYETVNSFDLATQQRRVLAQNIRIFQLKAFSSRHLSGEFPSLLI